MSTVTTTKGSATLKAEQDCKGAPRFSVVMTTEDKKSVVISGLDFLEATRLAQDFMQYVKRWGLNKKPQSVLWHRVHREFFHLRAGAFL